LTPLARSAKLANLVKLYRRRVNRPESPQFASILSRELDVNTRRLLSILVFALPLLVVAFAIVMGSHALFVVSGDSPAAIVTRWIGGAVAMLLAMDLILLVAVLGIRQLAEEQQEDETT